MSSFDPRRASVLIMAMFFLQPLTIGGWLALIPYVKADLGLSKGELAFALMGSPLALIPTLQFAAGVVSRMGIRRMFTILFPLQSLAILLPLLAWNGPALFLALACFGVTVAFMEVGLNLYAGRLEKHAAVLIMNRCHGFWAAGIAAGSAWVAVFGGFSPILALAALSGLGVLAGLWVARTLPRLAGDDGSAAPPRRKLSQLPKALIMIAGGMAFVTMAEGAMADWAAVYLAERMGSVETTAGIAVTIFSVFLAGGRFIGDAMKARMGPVRMARMTIACAVIGLLLIVLPLPLIVAYPGFALVGFGVSAGFPLGVSAVAGLDDTYEAANIALMSTVALCGFLVGPPMIGLIGEAVSLSVGLAALIPGLLIAIVLMKWLAAGESARSIDESTPTAGESQG